MTLEGVTRDRDDAVFRRVDIVVGWWIPTRSATPSTALVPQRKVGFPIPNAHLLLGFQGTKTARREGISSPFSDAGGCTSPQNSGVPPLGSVHRGCKHRSSALTTGSNLEYCDAILSQPRCRFRLLIANYMPASGYCRSSVTCLGCKSCQLSSRKTNQGQTPESCPDQLQSTPLPCAQRSDTRPRQLYAPVFTQQAFDIRAGKPTSPKLAIQYLSAGDEHSRRLINEARHT